MEDANPSLVRSNYATQMQHPQRISRQYERSRSVNEYHRLKLRSSFDFALRRALGAVRGGLNQGLVYVSGFRANGHALDSDSDRLSITGFSHLSISGYSRFEFGFAVPGANTRLC